MRCSAMTLAAMIASAAFAQDENSSAERLFAACSQIIADRLKPNAAIQITSASEYQVQEATPEDFLGTENAIVRGQLHRLSDRNQDAVISLAETFASLGGLHADLILQGSRVNRSGDRIEDEWFCSATWVIVGKDGRDFEADVIGDIRVDGLSETEFRLHTQ